jgi:hypothetical protein
MDMETNICKLVEQYFKLNQSNSSNAGGGALLSYKKVRTHKYKGKLNNSQYKMSKKYNK